MKPYTRFLLRRMWSRFVRPIVEVCAVCFIIFYGLGAVQGMDGRAQHEAEKLMRDRIANIK